MQKVNFYISVEKILLLKICESLIARLVALVLLRRSTTKKNAKCFFSKNPLLDIVHLSAGDSQKKNLSDPTNQ